jgi:hypothetical protein
MSSSVRLCFMNTAFGSSDERKTGVASSVRDKRQSARIDEKRRHGAGR